MYTVEQQRDHAPTFASQVLDPFGTGHSLAMDQFDTKIIVNNDPREPLQKRQGMGRPLTANKVRATQPKATIEEKPKRLLVSPVEATESEFPRLMEKYVAKADQKLKKSFSEKVKEIVDECMTGQDLRLLELTDGELNCGFAAVNINNKTLGMRRLQIVYFTTREYELYTSCLKELLNYLWKKDPCKEIWISLQHFVDEKGSLGLDKHLEKILKENGFRLKRVTNDSAGGKRISEFSVKRPGEATCELK